MSAMAMAVYFNGLDPAETAVWTDAMMRSGVVLDLSVLGPGRVDKHSTGGVGDKISIPLGPAAAACGVKVPMIAGRGLGHSGGTIDKLEAIAGYRADLSSDAFRDVIAKVGCCINGQTDELAPADKRLYALRDVTATVESIPLITASIMSKKLAEGIEGLVLDVKVGRGAFMKTEEQARRLAESLVRVGERMGCRVVAFLTRMDAPLGRMVGNGCEIVESLETLRGGGPDDVRELVVTLGGAMVELALGTERMTAREKIAAALDDGTALKRFEAMVLAQGGDLEQIAPHSGETSVLATDRGFVTAINGLEVGLTSVSLGAGRATKNDVIDLGVGLRVEATVGTQVKTGDPLMTVLHGKRGAPSKADLDRLCRAFSIGPEPIEQTPLIIDRIG